MTAGAGLVVGVAADGDGVGRDGWVAIGVRGQPAGAEGRQAAGLHVGGDGDLLGGQGLRSQREEQGTKQ